MRGSCLRTAESPALARCKTIMFKFAFIPIPSPLWGGLGRGISETKCNLYFFVSCFFSAVTLTADEIGEWKELKGEHFIVCYLQNEDFADDVLDKSEVYYSRIAADLNYPRYSEFWTWDKRVKIYIHPNLESFLKATGQPQWSRGMADYNNKQIISYAWSGGFLESLLPHEIAHLIFRDFVGFKSEIPLWLDEGWPSGLKSPREKKARG